MKSKLLREPIYGSTVLVLSGGSEVEAQKAAAKWFTDNSVAFEEKKASSRGEVFIGSDMFFALWVKDARDIPSLAHEAIHVGVALMAHVGVPVNTQTDEALAYYCDWLVREALKR